MRPPLLRLISSFILQRESKANGIVTHIFKALINFGVDIHCICLHIKERLNFESVL